MKTKLSSKGQIVLPAAVRHKLGLETGASLEVATEDNRIILSRAETPASKAILKTSPITGLPVLSFGRQAPVMTSHQVRELLADFP